MVSHSNQKETRTVERLSLSPLSEQIPSHRLSTLWDPSVIADLLHIETVWAVLVTNGSGEQLFHQQRKDGPRASARVLDVLTATLARSGTHLGLGDPRFSVMMFAEGLIVARHGGSEQSAFVFASPDANLGQLLAHVRRVYPQDNSVSGGRA